MNLLLQSGMIAILALFGSSLAAQPYLAPPEIELSDANGVSLLSGSASLSVTLGSIGAGDSELSYVDNWSSGPMSNNLSNVIYFTESGRAQRETATVVFNHSSVTFAENEDGTYSILRDHDGSLEVSTNGQVYTNRLKNGEVRTYGLIPGEPFAIDRKLLTRSLSNGVFWTYDWEYSGQFSRVKSVRNNFGYKIELYYSNNGPAAYGNLAWFFPNEVRFFNLAQSLNPVRTAFRSTASNTVYLTSIGGQNWAVEGRPAYDAMQPTALFRVKTPSSTTFNSVFRPVQLKLLPPNNSPNTTSATVNGITTNYSFQQVGSAGTTIVTDPLGARTVVQFQSFVSPWSSASGLNSITNELGQVTTYAGFTHKIASVTNPEGDKREYGYFGPVVSTITYKAKPGSGLPDQTELLAYPSNCTNPVICYRPTSYTDRNGRTTFYEYDPQHGGVIRETLPADANGLQAVKRYAYAQRTAWIMDGAGGYMTAGPPIWLKTEERTCRATATVGNACQGGSADELVTTYDYGPNSGPNNLLLRGIVVTAGGQSQRTCFTYDVMGNKTSDTNPLGTAGSCPQ